MQFHPFPSPDDETAKRYTLSSETKDTKASLWRFVAASASVLLIVAILLVTFRNSPQTKQILAKVGFGPATVTHTPVIPTPTSTPSPTLLEEAFPASAIISIAQTNPLLNTNGSTFQPLIISQDHSLFIGTTCTSTTTNTSTCSISTMNAITEKTVSYFQLPPLYGVSTEIISNDNRYISFVGYSSQNVSGPIGIIDTKTGAVHVFFNLFNNMLFSINTIQSGQLIWDGSHNPVNNGATTFQEHIYSMNLLTFVSTELIHFDTIGEWTVSYPYLHYLSATDQTNQIWVNLADMSTFIVPVSTLNNVNTSGRVFSQNIYSYTIYSGTDLLLSRQTLPNGQPEVIHNFKTHNISLIAANARYIVYQRDGITAMWDINNNREITIGGQTSGPPFRQITDSDLYLTRYNNGNSILEIVHLA